MYTSERKVHSGVYICLLIECVCMCVVGDIEVHKKLSLPKGDKLTNFLATMNVFLQDMLLYPAI